MATATQRHFVPLKTYLAATYEPDMNLLTASLRSVMRASTSTSGAAAVLFWFYQHEKEWNIRAIQEQRTRLTPTRYRIPDVCVFRRDLPREQIFTHPQLVAIEVLSPEDRQTRLQERIDDFINSECRISGRLILPGESDGTARTGTGLIKSGLRSPALLFIYRSMSCFRRSTKTKKTD